MPTDLSPHKITLGDSDYPAKHNSMIDAVQAAINAVEVFENAALLNQAVIDAQTAETNAASSETNAADSKTYATEWANKAEDTLVSAAAGGDQVDDYSALHHASKAAAANQSGQSLAFFFGNS